MDNQAFSIFAISAAILALHLYVLAGITGGLRAKYKQFVNPEDAKLNKGEVVAAEHESVGRSKRAHANALENAVPFFAVGLLYAMSGASRTGALAYFGTFVAMRLLHSVFYMKNIQPFRTISFAIGALCILGMAVHVIGHYA